MKRFPCVYSLEKNKPKRKKNTLNSDKKWKIFFLVSILMLVQLVEALRRHTTDLESNPAWSEFLSVGKKFIMLAQSGFGGFLDRETGCFLLTKYDWGRHTPPDRIFLFYLNAHKLSTGWSCSAALHG